MHNSATQTVAQQEIDARGLICPEPLMLVRNRIRSMAPGDVLFVVATDPSTERDFANLCRFMGHTLLAADREGSTYRYWIRKGSKSSD